MNFGVCAILKNENLYLREWVEHYINLGFDKIILYDNNEINGEIPNVVIQDYIDKGIVDVYSEFRGKKQISSNYNGSDSWTPQVEAYNKCLNDYKDTLNWILFVDIDEFLTLEKHKKIQYVFEDINYSIFDDLLIGSIFYGDDGQLYYTNQNVQERFTKIVDNCLEGSDVSCNTTFKCFANTENDKKFKLSVHHRHDSIRGNTNYYYIEIQDNLCTNFGKECHSIMYLKHYYTKSLTEFLYKLKYCSWDKNFQYYKQKNYKVLNEWTEEHEKLYQNIIENNTDIQL